MSVQERLYLQCDGYHRPKDETVFGSFRYDGGSPKAARVAAAAAGWWSNGTMDLCPDHAPGKDEK